MKVTFDKNTYEFVVDPEKASNQMTTIERDCFKTINKSIIDGRIIPYISESILTIETINSKDRKSVFSRRDRITVTTKTKTASKNNFVTEVNISSNTDAYPENNDHYQIYLPKAIKLGFKILPIFRFGKIVNPMIKKSWYYIPKSKHNFDIPFKFSTIVDMIEEKGYGFSVVKKLLGIDENDNQSWINYLYCYKGSDKLLSKAIAEWSDADSIAIHIACDINLFCTNDGSTRNKANSVFSTEMKSILTDEYKIIFVTPIQLSEMLKTTI